MHICRISNTRVTVLQSLLLCPVSVITALSRASFGAYNQ
uniref:Uncharacterized protein n=1 Tax=Anguilla anguilla TaxID=7936 RepID=A0A0E9R5K4_ANGAN